MSASDSGVPSNGSASAGARAAAFFDVDGTLVRGQLFMPMIRPLFRWGYLRPRHLAKTVYRTAAYRMGLIRQTDIDRMWEETLEFVKGKRRDDIERVLAQAFEHAGTRAVRPAARFLVGEHRRLGHEVYLATSQTEEASKPLAALLQMDGLVATRMETNDGVYTGRFVEGYCYGERKADQVERFCKESGIDLSASWFYTDAAVDLPLLERVGHPVAVNPDKALAAAARHRRWRVLTFA